MRWLLSHRRSKSVTYVLNLLCYLCSEPGPIKKANSHTLDRTQMEQALVDGIEAESGAGAALPSAERYGRSRVLGSGIGYY
jgi:hypothetical protein